MILYPGDEIHIQLPAGTRPEQRKALIDAYLTRGVAVFIDSLNDNCFDTRIVAVFRKAPPRVTVTDVIPECEP